MKKVMFFAVLAIALCFGASAKAASLMDVPEGHWAADAVQRLVDKGIVEGYPDGTFKGDRNLTRYEYAVIVDRLVKWADDKFCDKSGECGGMDPAELKEIKDIIEKLAAEFKDELAALKARVDDLDGRTTKIEDTLAGMASAKFKLSGQIRQRIDVLDTDANATALAAYMNAIHGFDGTQATAINNLDTGYEMYPALYIEDADTDDGVYWIVGLSQVIQNQSVTSGNADNGELDIEVAYAAMDFAPDVRELDVLKVTSGYQPLVFGPLGALVDNRGAPDSSLGIRLDVGKDVVTASGFVGMNNMAGNTNGIGATRYDAYVAARLNIDLPFATIGGNMLADGVAAEKAWGFDVEAPLLKESLFLKAIRGEYFKVTDLDTNTAIAAGTDDASYLVELDIYESKSAKIMVGYADIPAIVGLTGVDLTPLSEYDVTCPNIGLDITPSTAFGGCRSFESGNILFPAGFKGVGLEATYTVLGDVELGAEFVYGDYAGGTVPAALDATAAANNTDAEGMNYPAYGSFSVTKPVNKNTKFRVEYFQQGQDPVVVNRLRTELVVSF